MIPELTRIRKILEKDKETIEEPMELPTDGLTSLRMSGFTKKVNSPATIMNLTNPSHHTTVCETVVWSLMFRVENVFEKKMKKPGL